MNSFFFGLQAVDFCSHAIVSAAAIGAKVPINSNANNFAFRKKAFEDAGGYGGHGAVISGDDDMLLQRIANRTKWNVRYMPDLRGAVTTIPSQNTHDVVQQRKRWGSKTIHYGFRQVCMLSLIFAFYCCIFATAAWGFFNHIGFIACVAMLVVKTLGELLLMIPGTKMMGQTHLRKYLLIASVIQLPMVVWAVLSGVFGKFTWKDQEFTRRAG
jgi:cellulose synthase/poly-beta-1,6-N-acetylglucosamine synthase-like glycosyltransferase